MITWMSLKLFSIVDDNLQNLLRLHQFTFFDGLENLIRVIVGFEITVDIIVVYKIKQ